MFENLSGMEIVFLGCAIVGGGLFILRSIMMLAGLGSDDGHGHIHDGGGDVHDAAGGDVHDAHGGDGEPVADFKMVTLHGLTAFLLMFGLVGFLILRNNQATTWAAGSIATAAGAVTMFIIAKIFQSSRKLQSDGTIYPKDMVGAEGSVYLVIRPGEIGKVQVTVRDTLKVLDARAKDSAAELKTGAHVRIVGAEDVLIVEPA